MTKKFYGTHIIKSNYGIEIRREFYVLDYDNENEVS